ncbi:MAG: FtsX-like permease family protein [Pseudomonadota bacterium]
MLGLTFAYLRDRALTTTLNVLLLGLATATLVILLLFSSQLGERLSRDAAGIDLVVGAKGSPLQLILSSLYQIDAPTGNIPQDTMALLERQPSVDVAIPIALGDNFRGVRIVGTEPRYLDLYDAKIAEGQIFSKPSEVVIGSDVARKLGMELGQRFVGSHGLGDAGAKHDHAPFMVVGILRPTGGVVDRLIVTSIKSVWEAHGIHYDGDGDHHDGHGVHDNHDEDHQDQGHHKEEGGEDHDHDEHNGKHQDDEHHQDEHHDDEAADHDQHDGEHADHDDLHDDEHHDKGHDDGVSDHDDDHHASVEKHAHERDVVSRDDGVGEEMASKDTKLHDEKELQPEISALLVKYRNAALGATQVPRLINRQTDYQAAVPAVETARLLSLLGVGIDSVRLFAWLLALTGGLAIFIALLNAATAREGDLALLRLMGASREDVFRVIMLEGLITAAAGGVVGILTGHIALGVAASQFDQLADLGISPLKMLPGELFLLLAILTIGVISAVIPAIRVFRNDLAETLARLT